MSETMAADGAGSGMVTGPQGSDMKLQQHVLWKCHDNGPGAAAHRHGPGAANQFGDTVDITSISTAHFASGVKKAL